MRNYRTSTSHLVSSPVHNFLIHEGILKILGINVYNNKKIWHAQHLDLQSQGLT
jgi:hypothetical protein